MTALIDKQCVHSTRLLEPGEIEGLLTEVNDWLPSEDGKSINKAFRFANFIETMAFVNQVADIANRQDHHPDMQVSYNRCTVSWSTHSVGGLSENDFICAANVDALSS